jgi:hypothetical protein
MVLTNTTLNVLTSRRNQITKTANVLDLRTIQNILISADDDGNET